MPASRLDLYVDGQNANNTITGAVLSAMDVAAATTTIRIGIGHYNGNLWGPFSGAIDAVRYSTGARYSGTFAPDVHPAVDATTIGLWNFDEGTGTVAAVAGQMTAAADLTNGPTWTSGPEDRSTDHALPSGAVSTDAYARSGVDQHAADRAVAALVGVLRTIDTGKPLRSVLASGHYAAVLEVAPNLGIAVGTDGVGSKLILAEQTGRYDTVGIDCVAMNVNDVVCVGAEPIALLDYLAVEQADPEVMEQIAHRAQERAPSRPGSRSPAARSRSCPS